MKNNDEKNKKKELLLKSTAEFCEKYLDDEYLELTEKLINRLSRKRQVPFLKGSMDIWAASIIYALGQVNYLFDETALPSVTYDDVCDFFGTKKSTTSQRAKQIRDLFKMTHFSEEFLTSRNAAGNPLRDFMMINGFIVDKKFLFERTQLRELREFVVKEELSEQEYEKNRENIYKSFFEKLENMEIDYSGVNLELYTEILNRKLVLPFEAKVIDETDLFGEMVTTYSIHRIHRPSTPKDLRKGLLCECVSGGVNTRVPMKDLSGIVDENNRSFIEQYQNWFRSVQGH